MRALTFLASFILALPGVVASLALIVLDRAIRTKGLLRFFLSLLESTDAGINWVLPLMGLTGAALIVAGCRATHRFAASVIMFTVVLASHVLILSKAGLPGTSQLLFWTPGILSLTGYGWLIASEHPGNARPSKAAS